MCFGTRELDAPTNATGDQQVHNKNTIIASDPLTVSTAHNLSNLERSVSFHKRDLMPLSWLLLVRLQLYCMLLITYSNLILDGKTAPSGHSCHFDEC